MPISISRLRQWFAGAAIVVCVSALGTYFFTKHRVQNALKQIPGKLNIEYSQSTQQFTISKSEQGRTLFRVQASKAIQFKQGGRVELHDVNITFYGADSSRFDQIYGRDFEYDQQSGNITSMGEVSIDLQANPQGTLHPDQAPPKELKNPLHLKTSGLVFNQKTGDAWTKEQIDFRVPQASGSAVGAKYVAQSGVLTLESQLRITVNGDTPSALTAERAILQKAQRQIVLYGVRAQSPTQRGQADEVTLFLRADDTLERVVGVGDVQVEATAPTVLGRRPSGKSVLQRTGSRRSTDVSHLSAQKLEVQVKPNNNNEVLSAALSGDVHIVGISTASGEAFVGRALISFGPRNTITKVHADEEVKLVQHQDPQSAQNVEITAPAMDFFVADGNRLARAVTAGPPRISLLPAADKDGERTVITADKFTALFDSKGQLSQVHGEPDARVVSTLPSRNSVFQPERVSTSDRIEAIFRPQTGIEAVVQQGRFEYVSGTQRAFASLARYQTSSQILVLNGSPRVLDIGLMTTADELRLDRNTGQIFAQGHVKTTYNDLKPQPGGALLGSSDPVHVTAQSMTAHSNPSVATYTGNARLWQNANAVDAPSIQFQKEERTVIAEAGPKQKVSMALIGTDKSGKATPVNVTATRMTYRDSERQAHLEGGVTVRGADLTITSNQMDVFLQQPSAISRQPSASPEPGGPSSGLGLSRLEKIVASGSVLIAEPNRRATGDQLTYTASDDKFVLTGGPPSIFDAEHGKITGVSLTLFRRDDRFVVEGDSSSPAVTQTRVVR